jgi:hypothetical protein
MSGFYSFLIYLLNENSNLGFAGSASLPDCQIHPIFDPSSDASLIAQFRFKLRLAGIFDA